MSRQDAAPEAGGERREPQFDAYAGTYDDAIDDAIGFAGAEHDLYTRVKADLLARLAERTLGPTRELRALDVGCGPGETDEMLEGTFGRLSGVDVSAEMVEVASSRNPWAEYAAYGEGEPLPFEDGGFDLAFTICVLHHVPPADWERFVAEMARVTRPGGIVAVIEHNPWNPLTRKVVRDCEFDVGVELLSRPRTRRLLSAGPLEPVESSFILFFPREGARLRRIERALGRVPAGAQYYVAARRR